MPSILDRLTKICLALDGAESENGHSYAKFSARKKTFAYYLENHHGDGIIGLWCKVGPGDNVELIRAQPERFYMPAYVGPRGWVGLRLDRGKPDWEEIRELVGESYRLTTTPALNRRKRASPAG